MVSLNQLLVSFVIGISALACWFNHDSSKQSGLLQRNADGSVRSALSHLSSSSLVQRAAADCAADSKCIPTVNELVDRAAASCASDPNCICDWAKYPKKCFLSEVARHKQLTHDAKALVSTLRAREEQKELQLQNIKLHNSKFESLLSKGRKDLTASKIAGAKKELVQAEVQHRLTEQVSDGHVDLHIPLEQTKELEEFAQQIVAKEREKQKVARSASSNIVTKQLGLLSSQIKVLMKKVADNGKRHGKAENVHPHSPETSTAEQLRKLTEVVAKLTGKVGDLEHGVALHPQRGRTEELADDSDPAGVSGDVERDRSVAIRHQRAALTEALRRGRHAVDHGNPSKAETAVLEVQYYRSALARLEGHKVKCQECDSLKQEAAALSTDLRAPTDTTSLADEPPSDHPSATALERSFDAYLSAGDRALVSGRIAVARSALNRAKGRFAELETRRLPGADGVIKHEMRSALRALAANIAARAHDPAVAPSLRSSHRPLAPRGRWQGSAEQVPHHRSGGAAAHRKASDREHGGGLQGATVTTGNGRRGAPPEENTPGSSALLRRMLARPGYYSAKTLRLATEGLRTATLRADGALEAFDPSQLRRIRRHFREA